MINIMCHTNLDLSNERWPDKLPTMPAVGDEIESATRWKDGFRLTLQVVKVRWSYNSRCGEWYPQVELHMTNFQKMLPCSSGAAGSIRAFYEWYAPKVGKTVSSFI